MRNLFAEPVTNAPISNQLKFPKYYIQGFWGILGTWFGSLELKIASLKSDKIIIEYLESEKIGSLQVHTRYLTSSLTLLEPPGFGDFRKKSSSLRLPYQRPSSSAHCARELFSGSNGSASLVDCTRKKFFAWGVRFFVSDVISGGLFGHLDPLCLALGTNR